VFRLLAAAMVLVACGAAPVPNKGSAPDPGSDGGSPNPAPAGPPAFTVTDVGPATVTFIDDRGRLAGIVCPSDGSGCVGSIYTPDSGWAPAPMPSGAEETIPIGIDRNDTIAHNAMFPYGLRSSYLRAYVGDRPFPTAADHAPQTTFLNAIHPITGHTVGYDEVLGGAFLFDGKMVTPIAVQPGKSFDNGGPSQAMAVNSRDQVVGWMRVGSSPGIYNDGHAHAFLWENGTARDLGAHGFCESLAVAVNDAGLVAGVIDMGDRCGEPQLFLWDGQMHVLGCAEGGIDCWAFGMNARGDVVGNALSSVPGERGFLYRDGRFYWLDELTDAKGWTFEYPQAINDAGRITGFGHVSGAQGGHSFVLTPR